MSETVKCFYCDKQVRLLRDGTYGKHGWGSGHRRMDCKYSGKVHERHSGDFRIIKRNPNVWMCQCLCGDAFLGDTYDNVEAQWKEHWAEQSAQVPS